MRKNHNVTRKAAVGVLLALALCLCGAVPTGFAQQGPAVSARPGLSQDEANREYFTDAQVMTHEGRQLRFYSDILKDKRVLINFFYTNCPTAPPGMARLFKVQSLLGDELGTSILLISISVDPERDSLEALQEYAGRYNPKKGWLFLTGNAEALNLINRKLGNTLRLPEGHLRLFLLGNLETGHWMKMLESAPPISIVDGLRSLATETAGTSPPGERP
jgi:protein SCO1/2